MKKLCVILFLTLMTILMTGCPDKGGNKESEVKPESSKKTVRMDKKAASLVLQNYMRFLMVGNHGAMRTFYSAGLKKKIKVRAESAQVSPVGYAIGEGEISEDKGTFKINIYNSNRNEMYFSDDEFEYVLKMEGSSPRIDSISKKKSTELYAEGTSLFKREQDKLKGSPVMTIKDLPAFITAKEASSLEQKYRTPVKKFGPFALSPDSSQIIFSTMDRNSFVGMLSEGESASAFSSMNMLEGQGGQGSQQGGGQGGQEGQGGQGGQQEKGKSYNITSVDLYFGCEVKRMSFSQDGKLFVVEYGQKGGQSRIAVYDAASGERKVLKSSKQFGTSRFSLKDPYFSGPEELVFRVAPSPTASYAQKRLRGYWRLDLKKGVAYQF